MSALKLAPPFEAAPIDLRQPEAEATIRTIPELIDYNAQANPEALFCVQALHTLNNDVPKNPSGPDASPSAVYVTMRHLRTAVLRCSRRLQAEVLDTTSLTKVSSAAPSSSGGGGGGDPANSTQQPQKPDPVALFMDSDMGLVIHLFALLSLGVPVLLLSARLGPSAIRHLLTATGAQAVVCSPRLTRPVESALVSTNGEVVEAAIHRARPFQAYLGESDDGCASPAEGSSICAGGHYVGEKDRNVIILHSSGTTGLPKPIYQPHKYLLSYASCHLRTKKEDVGALNLSTLPLYHGFGLVVACLALGIGKPFLLPPPQTIPTAPSTISLIQQFHPRSLMTVPHILEELAQLPPSQGAAALRPLQFVACGGGPLKVAVGEALAAEGVALLNHFGSTETGPLGAFTVPDDRYDWHYWPLRRDVDIKAEAVDGFYQISTRPFGWDEDFVLQDRFERDEDAPARAPAFRATGRRDDLIVLVTGEKVQPQLLEAAVEGSGLVRTAVVFGDGEFELGLLVEPSEPQEDVDAFRRRLWPVVREACGKMDSHAQIASPAGVVLVRPGQSVPRSDKGSVLRREVYRRFEADIRQAYEDIKSVEAEDSGVKLDPDHLEHDLEKLIKREVGDDLHAETLGPDDDLFEKGVNSLQAVRIQRTIAGAVGNSKNLPVGQDEIGHDFVYKHPTIHQMTNALVRKTLWTSAGEDDIGDFVTQFSLRRETKGHVILLTGSSGSLGSYVLDHLVSIPDVTEVICLVRGSGTGGREPRILAEEQIRIAERKGVRMPTNLRYKLTALEANPSATRLGLSSDKYLGVCSKVTHVLHAAWPMDFQRALSSFQDQFAFLNNLLRLTRDAHKARPLLKPRLLFVSSIAVVGNYHQVHGSRIVPEQVMADDQVTNDFGYGKAKFVCERIIANAAADFPNEMEVASVRVGQVSGAQDSGFWNSKEHFPTLIKMCHKLGKFPRLEGTLSWLPVDTDAAVLGDILLSDGPLRPVYHVENPVRQDWTPIMAIVAERLGHPPSAFVDYGDWLHLVRAHSAKKENDDPEVSMLMHFFENGFRHMSSGGVILDTSGAREKSSALRNADKVGEETVARYAQQWQQEGMLT